MTVAFLDWENLWIGLRCRGYSISPALVTEGLVGVLAPRDEPIRIVVVTKTWLPTRPERRAITAFASALDNVTIEFSNVHNFKGGAADVEIGFRVGRTVEAGPGSLLIGSADRDVVEVARLAAKAAREHQDRPPTDITVVWVEQQTNSASRCRTRKPYSPPTGPYRLVELTRSWDGVVPAPVHRRREPTLFDIAAWSLARVTAPGGRQGEAAALHDGPVDQGAPTWWARLHDYIPNAGVATVDHVLWLLGDLADAKRLRFTPEEAAASVAAKKPGLQRDARPIVDALLTTDFIRIGADGLLETRPSLREGILMPVRRAVLRLLRAEGFTATHRQVKQAHVHRYHPSMKVDDAEESWGLVDHALTGWKAVSTHGGGQERTLRLKCSHALVRETFVIASEILGEIGDARLTKDEVRERLGGDLPYGRWLRVLTDAQLLTHDKNDRGGTWRAGSFRLPPSI
jgi:hypothetical protein